MSHFYFVFVFQCSVLISDKDLILSGDSQCAPPDILIQKHHTNAVMNSCMSRMLPRHLIILSVSSVLLVIVVSQVLYVYLPWRLAVIAGQNVYAEVRLSLPPSGTFKVLQLADVQISRMDQVCLDLTAEQRKWPCDAHNTTAFIQRLVVLERPDLVVFSGDNVVHEGNYFPDGVQTHSILDEVLRPIVHAGIPFVSILGNHDVESPFMSASGIHDYLRRKGALVSGNGLVRVEDTDGFPLWHVWLLDYMHRYCLLCDHGGYSMPFIGSMGGYAPITNAQVQFFRRTSEAQVPAIVFAHVPLPAYQTMLDHFDSGRPEARWEGIVGDRYDPVSQAWIPFGYNWGNALYESFAEANVVAMSVGHDHTNDFCGRSVNGSVALCYAGGAGYQGYGRAGWKRRARLFAMGGDGKTYTYKRLDDEYLSILHQQQLS